LVVVFALAAVALGLGGVFEGVFAFGFFEVVAFALAVDLGLSGFDVFLVVFGGTWVRLTIRIQLMALRVDKISVLRK
jgi:hypothetical protein